MKTVEITSNPKKIREAIESTGSRIGSVQFRKRANGEVRSMAYRLHVTNPSTASKPRGSRSKDVDKDNVQMTVLDVNKQVKAKDGTIGRGAWRVIPLENVISVRANKVEYKVKGRG
jgi:hypothetical protein